MSGNIKIFNFNLQVLKEELRCSRKAAFSEGTRRNLATQWRSYFLFCEHFNAIALSVHIDNLCLFAQF